MLATGRSAAGTYSEVLLLSVAYCGTGRGAGRNIGLTENCWSHFDKDVRGNFKNTILPTTCNRPASVRCEGRAAHIASMIELLRLFTSGAERFVSWTAGQILRVLAAVDGPTGTGPTSCG